MNSREYDALRSELDNMLAIQAGQTAVLTAMIQTHPRYEDLQLATTAALELMLGKMPNAALTDEMKEKARAFVEQLQRLQPAEPGAPGAIARAAISKS